MKTQIISTKELRLNLPSIKKAVDMGKSFVLIYRSRPFAELRPLPKVKDKTVSNIDVVELPAFGMWKDRIKKTGGTDKFLQELRAKAW